MSRVNRTDRAELAGRLERTAAGAARVPARLGRVGVQYYVGADGLEHGELRLPEEVFAPASMASLRGATVTWLHPDGAVTPENWRALSVGHVGDDVRADGQWLAASLTIAEASAIDAVERRELQEISLGYDCRLERAPGEYLGQRYEYIQRDIRCNHCALLPLGWARAGRGARLMLDSWRPARRSTTGAVSLRLDGGPYVSKRLKTLEIDSSKGVLRFDGRDFDLGDEAQRTGAREAVLAHVRGAVPRADAIEAAALQPLLDELMGMLAGMTEQLVRLGEVVAAGAEMPASTAEAEEMLGVELVDSLAKDRRSVVEKARAMMPAIKTDGRPSLDIMREALKAAGHEVPAGKGREYVEAAFATFPVATFSDADRATIDSGAAGGDAPDLAKLAGEQRKRAGMRWKKRAGSDQAANQ